MRVTEQLSQFDHGVRRCLEKMFNSLKSDACWKQTTLPVRLGGLGLRGASRTAPAAFIESFNSTRKLLSQLLGHATSFVDGSEHVNLASFDQNLIVPGKLSTREILRSVLSHFEDIDFKASQQREFRDVLDSSLLRKIKAESNLRDKARLNSVSARNSGAWLMAIPNQKFGLFMSPQKFMVALRMWLGILVFLSPPSSVRCPCGTVIDPHGDHVLGCGHGLLRNKRHDTLCDVISTQFLLTTPTAKRTNGATATIIPNQEMCLILTSCRA